MKIFNIICSFDSAPLTEKLYNELKPQTSYLMVLENSTTEEKRFVCPEMKDLGRENIGFGGMHDWIWQQEEFLKYDFVIIWNNDVSQIPANFFNRLDKYLDSSIGIAAPALNDDGTGWLHMRKKGDYFRESVHVEDAVGIFNTKLFPVFAKYSPMDFYGVLDISLCVLSHREGLKNVIIDELAVHHELSGARKMAGVNREYINLSGVSIAKWHNSFPDLKELYEGFLERSSGVTVVIPNYNHNHLLKRAVTSALLEDVKKEVIVVDDCSPNQDYSILQDTPVVLMKHLVNKGLAISRNTAIASSKYDWIVPLDADDYFTEGGLATLWKEKKADINAAHLEYPRGGILQSRKVIPKIFLQDNQICGTALYHKDVWKNVNGYRTDVHTSYEDWNFWGKAAIRGYKFHIIDKVVYIYCGEADGMCAELGKNRRMNMQICIDDLVQFKEWLETKQGKRIDLPEHAST